MADLIALERISRDTDESTSVATQDAGITEYAKRGQHRIVATAVDEGVSGGTPIRDRPDFRDALARVGDAWDGVIMLKLDRGFRDLLDFLRFEREYCRPRGKIIISVREGIDTSTSMGRQMAARYVEHAEWELERMKERRSDAAERLMRQGYSNGGNGARLWGYKTVKNGSHYVYVPDPDVVPIVVQAVDDLLAGRSIRDVARRVGVHPSTIVRRLTSPELKGWITYKGEVMRDADGMPLMREPIIGEVEWGRLQAVLTTRATGRGVRRDANPWVRVFFCDVCGRELFLLRYMDNGRLCKYYRHSDKDRAAGVCPARTHVNGHRLEAQIEPLILATFDGMFIPEVTTEAEVSHADELARIDASIRDAEDKFIAAGGDVGTLARVTSGLRARADRLRAEEHPARSSVDVTDELVTDRWESLTTDADRGAMLRSMAVRLFAVPTGPSDAKLLLRQGPAAGQHWADIARAWTDADIEQLEVDVHD